jgi:flagellar biosynthesis/type III secretory pathway ATPase
MIHTDLIDALDRLETLRWCGHVRELSGLLISSDGPAAAVGDFCEIQTAARAVRSQVVGFRDGRVLLMPLEETGGVQAGDAVVARPDAALVAVGPAILGRVLVSVSRWTAVRRFIPRLSMTCMPRLRDHWSASTSLIRSSRE